MSVISSRPRITRLPAAWIQAASTSERIGCESFDPLAAGDAAIDPGAAEQVLARACSEACIAAGFPAIEQDRGIDGSLRLIATDGAGRALVSEIQVAQGAPPSLATEVVGVLDGGCEAILDGFDSALRGLGVEAESIERRATHGVPELEAAIVSIRRHLLGRCPIASRQPFKSRKGKKHARVSKPRQQSSVRQRGG